MEKTVGNSVMLTDVPEIKDGEFFSTDFGKEVKELLKQNADICRNFYHWNVKNIEFSYEECPEDLKDFYRKECGYVPSGFAAWKATIEEDEHSKNIH